MSNQPPRSPESPRSSWTSNGVALVAAIAVVAVVVGFVVIGLLVKGGDGAGTPASQQYGQKPTPTFPTQPPGHTIVPTTAPPVTTPSSPPPTNLPALHCTKAPAAPGKGQQFAKAPNASLAQDTTWKVTLHTNCGAIVMELDGKVAPQTVASFLFLSGKHYFDDTPCHRLTTSGIFVLQCGDPTGTGSGGPGYGYGIENAPKDLNYPAGTVAMARTSDPNSNGSQFFIVYQDSTIQDPTGYSIFGTVTKGLPIVQAVAAQGLAADQTAPKQPVSILSVTYAKA